MGQQAAGKLIQPIWPLGAASPPKPARSLWAPSRKPQSNFWGDVDGDGKETAWDDMLGDGLLEQAAGAEHRAWRGLPPEPDDEYFVDRRAIQFNQSTSADSSPASVLRGLMMLAFLALFLLMLFIGV